MKRLTKKIQRYGRGADKALSKLLRPFSTATWAFTQHYGFYYHNGWSVSRRKVYHLPGAVGTMRADLDRTGRRLLRARDLASILRKNLPPPPSRVEVPRSDLFEINYDMLVDEIRRHQLRS